MIALILERSIYIPWRPTINLGNLLDSFPKARFIGVISCFLFSFSVLAFFLLAYDGVGLFMSFSLFVQGYFYLLIYSWHLCKFCDV